MTTATIKTREGWSQSGVGSFDDYASAGDEVDETLYSYFLEVLPPAYWSNGLMQVGEPNSHVEDRPTFATFEQIGDRYFYRGNCWRAQRTEPPARPLTYEEKRAAERAKKDEAERAIKAKCPIVAAQVVAALGDGWTLRTTRDNGEPYARCYAAVIHPDGREFSLTTRDYSPDNRLEISGTFSYGPSELNLGFPRNETYPRMTVSIDRAPAAIAKKITRKLLPELTRLTAQIAERVKEHSDHRARVASLTARLAKLAGAKEQRTSHNSFSTYNSHGPYFNAKVYDGQIDLEITNLTESQADAIFAILKEATN